VQTRKSLIGNRKWLLLLLLFGFGLRLWQLTGQSFWFDEGWSWYLASLPLGEMANVTAGDRSPVLYYSLLHAWLNLAGDSEFAQRYLSLIADVATIALLWAITRRLNTSHTNSRLLLLPSLLYTLSPFAVWYAQETRMYAQVAMFCTASSYFLLRWLDSPTHRRRWLIASAVCLAVAIHSHYYAVFLLPAQALIVFGHDVVRRQLRLTLHWVIAAVGVVALVLPWLLFARGGFAYDDGFVFPLNTIDGRMWEWVRAFASGGAGYGLPEYWLAPMALAVALALWATWRNPRLLMALGLAVLPLLFAAIAVRVVYPYRSVFHPRYLIYVAPMLCVWLASVHVHVGAGLAPAQVPMSTPRFVTNIRAGASPAPTVIAIVALLVLWLPALYWHFTQPPVIRDDTRGAIRHVIEALEPGDAVVMARDNFAIRYYWPKISAQVGKTAPLLAAPEGLHGVLHGDERLIAQLNEQHAKRVRLILWQDDVVDPQKIIESTLWRNGYQIGEYNFGRIRLPLYQITSEQIQPIQGQPMANEATFGQQLTLQAAWQREQATAGDWFYVVLWWRPIQPLPKDYKVFIHVLDATGKPAFQDDRMQLNDLLPMMRWPVGETLRAPHAMVAPADLPAGQYRVFVGVYDPISGQRLTLADGRDELELPRLTVVRR